LYLSKFIADFARLFSFRKSKAATIKFCRLFFADLSLTNSLTKDFPLLHEFTDYSPVYQMQSTKSAGYPELANLGLKFHRAESILPTA